MSQVSLVDMLLGEHGVLYALFNKIEALDKDASLDTVQGSIAVLSATLVSHAMLEEELLFSKLEQHIGAGGPLMVMRAEHEQIEGTLQNLPKISDAVQALRVVKETCGLARDHFAKEENILFPLARQTLGDEKLAELGGEWSRRREVVVA